MNFDLIMGRQPLREMLLHCPERIIKVLVARHKEKDSLLTLLEEKGIPFTFVAKEELTALVSSDSHQSFVAKIKKRKIWDIRTFLEKKKSSFLLMLDSIMDPQNFGAIVRSAECFCVDGVIFSKNRGSSLTPSVTKASSGATELISLIEVSNLATTLHLLKEHDYLVIVADASQKARSLATFSFPEKCVVVMGSEERGVQDLICKMADSFISIPMGGKIASLNVAQAAAIFLSKWFMERG